MSVFFTSDTHFSHFNIIRYSNRPFKTAEEMDEKLILNWNAKVKPGDDVYHLGDFAFGNTESAKKIKRRLNGNIHLIKGNHEKPALGMIGEFVWVKDVAEVKVEGQSIFLSHYAHRVWNKSHHGTYHLYGHSHGSLPDDPNSLSFDCGVDCHNYAPLSFSEVKAIMAKKTFKPIDHHGEH